MSLSSAISALAGTTTIQRFTIEYEQGTQGVFSGEIVTVFNPTSLKFSKDVTWKISPVTGQATLAGYTQVMFCSAAPRTMTVDLFVDSYEGKATTVGNSGSALQQALASITPLNPFVTTPSGKSCSEWTSQIANLQQINSNMHQPPMCKLSWGNVDVFYGVLTSLTEEFTMFLADGTPVRATLSCTFTEAVPSGVPSQVKELYSADIYKTYVLRRGDTLSGVAQMMYNDATQWRLIADANQIYDPRDLTPFIGVALVIPRLDS